MIVNMSASDGCHSLAPITSLSTTAAANATHGSTDISMASQGHSSAESNSHDFNFLKRKLDMQDVPAQHQQHPHQQSPHLLDDYPTDNNNWKKRHVIHELTPNFGVNTFVDDYSVANVTATSTATTLTVPSDISFTNTSAFINDLFTYDANLIVPVPANLISHTDLHTDPSLMTTSTGLCLNSVPFGQHNDEDGSNWQATDLLELDHRYNAGLQTEINQLNPTIALKPAQEDNLRAAEQQQRRMEQGQRQSASYDTTQQQQQQQQQQQHQQGEFVAPQKQMTRLQTGSFSAGKYRPPQNDTETDQFEDKNLSWLLNFKFDEFPHLSPDVGGSSTQQRSNSKNSPSSLTTPTSHKVQTSPASSANTSATSNSSPSIHNERSRSPKSSSSKASKKFEELVMEVTSELDSPEAAASTASENVNAEDSSVKAPKKPPFTYTELIEYALEDKGELTVSGIYQWISDRFPYYKSNDDRWKNSVRHNLSINPHFRKGHKAPQGAGHLWTISSGDSAENVLAWEHKKQRLDLFFKMESMNRERLQQHKIQQQHQQSQQQASNCQHERCVYDEAAAAAATITQEMSSQQQHQQQQTLSSLNDSGSHQHHPQHHNQHPQCHDDPHMGNHYSDLLNDDDLRKTAGQILNGIHREVEVQSVNSIISTYQDVLLDNDFLNPINKDINLMHSQSSSHPSSHYYVTEIDPLELGIQMSHQVSGVEEEVLFNDEFNLNYFYNPGNDIVA